MKETKLGSKILMILSWQGWVLLETKSQIGCRLLTTDSQTERTSKVLLQTHSHFLNDDEA